MTSPKRLVAAIVLVACAPGVARAASPHGGAAYGQHDHRTTGHNWHIQIEVNDKRTALGTLVVYSQKCEETGFASGVDLDDGAFELDRATPDKKGRWKVTGSFTDRETARGTYTITRGDCTDSRTFKASNKKPLSLGLQREYPPAERIWTGSDRAAHRLRHLKNLALRSAPRLDTVREAAAAGYKLDRRAQTRCPAFYHARKHSDRMWGRVLDARRPQALVFWCDGAGKITLAAFMFRAPLRHRPHTFDGLMQWHRHGTGRGFLWMTHLWLVRNPAAAWATCAPFNALEAADVLRYRRPVFDGAHAQPCTDTEGLRPAD